MFRGSPPYVPIEVRVITRSRLSRNSPVSMSAGSKTLRTDRCDLRAWHDAALLQKIRGEAVVNSKAVCLALAVVPAGSPDILGIWIEGTERAKPGSGLQRSEDRAARNTSSLQSQMA